MGILRRCGTNFLYHLLRLHPACDASPFIWEDYFVANSYLLDDYISFTSKRWTPTLGGVAEGLEDALYRHLGDGLISFLSEQVDAKRLVTKTPSVRNLRNFFKLFPCAYLLILVRDGRAVVESSVKSFGTGYEAKMRDWANAADTILRFDQANRDNNLKYLIVRYEDIYSDQERELCRIFTFLDLDADLYDFKAAASLPIRGSSTFHGEGRASVHWDPVEKPSDFKPVQRWSHWGRALHERFNWIAGQYLVQFGYEPKRYTTNRLLWKMWNHAMVIWWQVRGLSRLFKGVRRRISNRFSKTVFISRKSLPFS